MPRCTYRFRITPAYFQSLGAPPAASIANPLLQLRTDQTFSKKAPMSRNDRGKGSLKLKLHTYARPQQPKTIQFPTQFACVTVPQYARIGYPRRERVKKCNPRIKVHRSNTKVTFHKCSSCAHFAWFCSCKGGPTWMMAGKLLSRIQ